MKKRIVLITFIILALVAFTMIAAGPNSQSGKSNKGHLYLYEKDGVPDWNIVEDGAWGKLTYNLSGSMFDYVFNGHGLVPGTDYTLIYYPDPWPGTGLKCLGSGVVNADGDIHIMNSVDTGDLPIASDDNPGAKIWLVKSSDVDCESVAWSVVGAWTWLVLGEFEHYIMITSQNPDGTFTGTGGYPAGASTYTYDETITGVVTGNQISLTTVYSPGSYTATATGTIDPDGSIAGTSPWVWEMTSGSAVSMTGKMIGWNPTEYLFEDGLITFDDVD